jgi:hypothetical protein
LSSQEDSSVVYNGQIYVGSSHLVIHGDGAIIDANGTGRFFDLMYGSYFGLQPSLTVYNLTMRHGRTGPHGSGCSGGAIAAWFATVNAFHCTFEYNTMPDGESDGDGGAVWTQWTIFVLISDCIFYRNEGDVGAAVNFGFGPGKFVYRDNVFRENKAGVHKNNAQRGGGFGVGGALALRGWCAYELTRNTFVDNWSAFIVRVRHLYSMERTST